MGMILGSGGKGGRRGRRALNAEINVTPFVDVMLVLLIVFMITAQAMLRGEDINLPKTASGPLDASTNDAPLAITVNKSGDIFVQNTEVKLDELGPKLVAIIGEGYDKPMYLRADETVPYGRIMEVTAEIRGAGYTRLSFITEKK